MIMLLILCGLGLLGAQVALARAPVRAPVVARQERRREIC